MKYMLRWLVFLLLPLTACAAESPPSTAADASRSPACEHSEFSAFWSHFVADVEYQRRHTRTPLRKLVVDPYASPDPKPMESSVSLSARDFPLSPGIAHIEALGLTVKTVPTDRGFQVHFSQPDRDYAVFYHFARDPCWVLVRIEDWSL